MVQMKKVLIYENRKSAPEIWDVSTLELRRKAFLSLFNLLDDTWQAYEDLKELEEPKKPSMTLEDIAKLSAGKVRKTAEEEHEEYNRELQEYNLAKRHKSMYDKAKAGDANATHLLLRERVEYEYENWNVYEVNE